MIEQLDTSSHHISFVVSWLFQVLEDWSLAQAIFELAEFAEYGSNNVFGYVFVFVVFAPVAESVKKVDFIVRQASIVYLRCPKNRRPWQRLKSPLAIGQQIDGLAIISRTNHIRTHNPMRRLN